MWKFSTLFILVVQFAVAESSRQQIASQLNRQIRSAEDARKIQNEIIHDIQKNTENAEQLWNRISRVRENKDLIENLNELNKLMEPYVEYSEDWMSSRLGKISLEQSEKFFALNDALISRFGVEGKPEEASSLASDPLTRKLNSALQKQTEVYRKIGSQKAYGFEPAWGWSLGQTFLSTYFGSVDASGELYKISNGILRPHVEEISRKEAQQIIAAIRRLSQLGLVLYGETTDCRSSDALTKDTLLNLKEDEELADPFKSCPVGVLAQADYDQYYGNGFVTQFRNPNAQCSFGPRQLNCGYVWALEFISQSHRFDFNSGEWIPKSNQELSKLLKSIASEGQRTLHHLAEINARKTELEAIAKSR